MPEARITISNGLPHPNGSAIRMSRKGRDGLPNTASWRALDRDYTVQLSAEDWDTPSPAPPGDPLRFTIRKGETSNLFSLNIAGPTGGRGYTIEPSSRDRVPPEIIIQP
jgi:hypothetical protein